MQNIQEYFKKEYVHRGLRRIQEKLLEVAVFMEDGCLPNQEAALQKLQEAIELLAEGKSSGTQHSITKSAKRQQSRKNSHPEAEGSG